MKHYELTARISSIKDELNRKYNVDVVHIQSHINEAKGLAGYGVELHFNDPEVHPSLLVEMEFITSINFNKRTLSGLILWQRFECLTGKLSGNTLSTSYEEDLVSKVYKGETEIFNHILEQLLGRAPETNDFKRITVELQKNGSDKWVYFSKDSDGYNLVHIGDIVHRHEDSLSDKFRIVFTPNFAYTHLRESKV